MLESGIYQGTLRHRRHQTRSHEFCYPVCMALLDIDRLPQLMQVSPLSAYNRSAIFSYQERDHFGDTRLSLRERVAADAIEQGVKPPAGKIFLLTNLRCYGYAFNPVSYYYCLGEDGRIATVMAEVNNTFGETCNYWLTPQQEVPARNSKRYRFPKRFHVSPFFGLNQIYDWTITNPAAKLTIQCLNFEAGTLAFDSTLSLERKSWNRLNLHRAMVRFPFMTVRIILNIHWQALQLFARKVPVVHHPGAGHATQRNHKDMGASWKTN